MRTAESWLEDGVTADLDFHRCVAAANGNPYIATVAGFLAGRMRQSIMFMRHNQNRVASNLMALNITEHSAIHGGPYEAGLARFGARDARAHHRRGEAAWIRAFARRHQDEPARVGAAGVYFEFLTT
jgi:DNA-binding FadR family transcriptional regulator